MANQNLSPMQNEKNDDDDMVFQDPCPVCKEELYLDNPNDSNGNAIPVSTLKSSNFDRGHKVAKSKGGSNIDLVIQDIRENRQTQEDFVAPN